MSKTFSRRLAALCMCMVAALCLVVLTGCNTGPTAEDVIKEGLASEFEQIVNQKGDDWDSMISEVESSQGDSLSQFGLTGEDFTKALLEGFAYEVTSVDVDEDSDTAVAHVTLTCKSMTDLQENLVTAMTNLQSDESLQSLSEDEIYAKVGETILQTVKDEPVRETTVDLTLNRDEEGTWTEDDSVSTEISNAMYS